MAEVDWSAVCAPVRAPGQGPPPPQPPVTTKDTDALRIDYLTSVLTPRKWYCIDLKKFGMDEHGAPTEIVQRQHFQILQIMTSHSKPSLMPTIESHSDTMLKGRLALSIQEVSIKADAEEPDGGVVVFEDSDPEWRSWSELGPWQEVRTTLQRFERAEGSVAHEGCIVLSDPVAATSPYALTDLRCAAITTIAELHRRGWRPTKARVLHESAAIGAMDTREATRMKAYYVVLLELPRCFPLSPRCIPSDQPIAYYKCLLQGVVVEPGLDNSK